MKKFEMQKKKNLYMIAGLCLSTLAMIPYLILGTGSIITYHDQLDGELFSYILTAKYLFTDKHIYPELLHGLPANGAVPPAPLFVLLYRVFRPFIAFLMSQWIIYLVGFLGMFLLLHVLTGKNLISFGIAAIFMMLPFYPVYGLCIPGQPLLVYGVYMLCRETGNPRRPQAANLSKAKKACYYLIIFLYGLCSSLVLVGFVWLLALSIFALSMTLMQKKKGDRLPIAPWMCALVLLCSYFLTNLSLIMQILFPSTGYVSHKTEIVISPQDIPSTIKDCFLHGISYAMSYHGIILLFAVLALSLLLLRREYKQYPMIPALFSGILLISILYGLYLGPQMSSLRNQVGGILKEFNLGRIAWVLPLLWCILAAYLLQYLSELLLHFSKAIRKTYMISWLSAFITIAILGCWGISVLLHSALRPNLSKLVKGDTYYALDWDRFFAEDIFTQIDDAIGRPKESYYVVSLGIYPAAAAYHGFYCLDGYSNNYPLEYKHTFREVIAGELAKSNYVRDFYDHWGNRCYITTAEQANYYTFEKKWNSVIYDLDLNTEKLKELNCAYIFSAAYLMNAEEMGLTLLQESPFETDRSWYHIYVYALE